MSIEWTFLMSLIVFFNEKNVAKVIKVEWGFWSSIISNINVVA
jgi:hypothetical protein